MNATARRALDLLSAQSGLEPAQLAGGIEQSPYIKVAYTIHSDVMHWATRNGRRTLCGITIPGYDPANNKRPYDPAWEVKTGRISLVTCKKCNGQSRSYRQ